MNSSNEAKKIQRKTQPTNLLLGAGVSLFEITTLGQPLEVLKTHMAAHRQSRLSSAIREVWLRGGQLGAAGNNTNTSTSALVVNRTSVGRGIRGFYQGLIPWAWLESSSSGAILLFTAAEIESFSVNTLSLSPAWAGWLGGCGGGIAQAYLSMGVCTTMKTAEITRSNQTGKAAQRGTLGLFVDILRKEGIRGVNKGVHAVALRQCTNWGSRMGFARLAEDSIRTARGKGRGSELTNFDKVMSSTVGGILGCWNHPIEVVRVEMQSMVKHTQNRPAKRTILNTAAYIYRENGLAGLFKGVVPRMGLSVWRTICFVCVADYVRAWLRNRV